MESTRKALEALRSCSDCEACLADDLCDDAPVVAEIALSLMDERDRLRMQVRAAEEVLEKAATVITVETAEGLAALCAIQAWQITPTEMYYRNEAEMEAANAEAGQ